MYNIFCSMMHKKLRVLLILSLSIITFFLALSTFNNSFSFGTQLSVIKSMFSAPLDKVYRIDVSYVEDFEKSGTAFSELKEFINQQEGTICGAYDQTGEFFKELLNNEEYINLNRESYAGTFREERPEISEMIFADKELLNIISSELSEDKFSRISKNGKDYLPLYVGKDFEKLFNVGDILTLSRNGTEYMVQGVLPDGKWLGDSDPITMPAVSLNHKFLAPFSDKDKTDSITQQSTIGKIFIMSSQNINERVLQKALELGIKLKITAISDFILKWEQDNYRILRLNFFLTLVVLTCSIISIISTLCVEVLLNRREYGIRIAFGATKHQIILSLCLEVLILNIISAAIAFFHSYFNYANKSIEGFQEIYLMTLCSRSLIGLILLIFFIAAVSLFIPTIILMRYNPVELVKEEE